LNRMLNPDEFLSDYGVRALSKEYENNPYTLTLNRFSGFKMGSERSGLQTPFVFASGTSPEKTAKPNAEPR
ncbi:hypothetical protein, partial [Chryseobacterium sp. CH1]|uniref:hypothetical protein n=1 Tax=Chryseobacterium sp. CH1 TaxID=713551 RepID=UPI001E428292